MSQDKPAASQRKKAIAAKQAQKAQMKAQQEAAIAAKQTQKAQREVQRKEAIAEKQIPELEDAIKAIIGISPEDFKDLLIEQKLLEAAEEESEEAAEEESEVETFANIFAQLKLQHQPLSSYVQTLLGLQDSITQDEAEAPEILGDATE